MQHKNWYTVSKEIVSDGGVKRKEIELGITRYSQTNYICYIVQCHSYMEVEPEAFTVSFLTWRHETFMVSYGDVMRSSSSCMVTSRDLQHLVWRDVRLVTFVVSFGATYATWSSWSRLARRTLSDLHGLVWWHQVIFMVSYGDVRWSSWSRLTRSTLRDLHGLVWWRHVTLMVSSCATCATWPSWSRIVTPSDLHGVSSSVTYVTWPSRSRMVTLRDLHGLV